MNECRRCGVPYNTKFYNQKYCSACKEIVHRQRKRVERLAGHIFGGIVMQLMLSWTNWNDRGICIDVPPEDPLKTLRRWLLMEDSSRPAAIRTSIDLAEAFIDFYDDYELRIEGSQDATLGAADKKDK